MIRVTAKKQNKQNNQNNLAIIVVTFLSRPLLALLCSCLQGAADRATMPRFVLLCAIVASCAVCSLGEFSSTFSDPAPPQQIHLAFRGQVRVARGDGTAADRLESSSSPDSCHCRTMTWLFLG